MKARKPKRERKIKPIEKWRLVLDVFYTLDVSCYSDFFHVMKDKMFLLELIITVAQKVHERNLIDFGEESCVIWKNLKHVSGVLRTSGESCLHEGNLVSLKGIF